MSQITLNNQASDISTPAAGKIAIFGKTDKQLYAINEDGTVTVITLTDAQIAAAYNSEVPAATQAEMEAGTETAIRRMSPERISEAIAALAPGAVVLAGVKYVMSDGSDVTGDGTAANPYASPEYALTQITDNDSTHRYAILIGPGVYTVVNPVACKPYVTIQGIDSSLATVIQPTTVGSNVFTLAINSSITNMTVKGATGAAAFYLATAGNSFVADATIVDCQYGIHVNAIGAAVSARKILLNTVSSTIVNGLRVTAGYADVYDLTIAYPATVTRYADVEGANASATITGGGSGSPNLTWCAFADDGGYLHMISCHFRNQTNGCWIDDSGAAAEIELDTVLFENTTTLDLLCDDVDAEFKAHGVRISRDKIDVPAGMADLFVGGFDGAVDKYRFMEDVAIGKDGDGHSFESGQGGVYHYGAYAKSYNGSVYADFTPGGVIQFPNLSAGTIIYFGDTDEYNFYGGVYIMGDAKLALGTGEIVWEYYDGGAADWVAFNIMDTMFDRSDQNAIPFNWDEGEEGSIRFDQNVKTGVTESDTSATGWTANTVDSVSAKWVRMRIVTAITTSPKFYAVGWKGSYYKIRPNGTRSNNGEARSQRSLLVEPGLFVGTAANESVDVSTDIIFPLQYNELENNKADALYFRFNITEDVDLSCGLGVDIELTTPVAPSGADQTAKLHFVSAVFPAGGVYDGTNPQVTQDFDFVATDGDSAYQSQIISIADRIDISQASVGDSIFMVLSREANEAGDDLAGSVVEVSLYLKYRQWQDGANYEA